MIKVNCLILVLINFLFRVNKNLSNIQILKIKSILPEWKTQKKLIQILNKVIVKIKERILKKPWKKRKERKINLM